MDLQPQISPKEDKTYLLADYWQELPDGTTQIDFGYILYSCQMSTQLSTIRTELGIHESNNFMNLSASNKHNIQYLEKLIGIHALPSLENSKLKGSVGRVLNHFKDMADLRLELGKYITIIPDEEERRFRILHNTAIMMIDNQYFMNIGDKKRDAIGYTMAKYFSAVWHAYPLTRKA